MAFGFVLGISARAEAEGVCRDPRVSVEGELDARWLASVIEMCEALGSLSDLDPSARLRVVPAGADVIVEVTLADGRRALRKVQSPDDLRLTMEALVMIPPTRPASEPPPGTPQPPGTVLLPRAAPELPRARSETSAGAGTEPAATSIGMEGGGIVGGRVAGRPTYVSVGPAAHAAMRVGSWLLGISARWDALQRPSESTQASFEMDSFAAGFNVALRVVDTDGWRLDSGVNALIVNETQSFQSSDGETAGSATDARVGALVRTMLGNGQVRFMAQVDGELSPSRVGREIRIDEALPSLPTWSIGLGIGAAWVGR